jgi:chromosome segregation ATPase
VHLAVHRKSDRFLQYLRELGATVGLTQKQLLEYKAKQLEVAEAAQPLIDAYSKAKDAARQQADEAARNNEKLAAGATAIARYRQSGQDLVASLREQLAAFGKTGDSLLLYRAQLAGVQEPVRQLLSQISALKDKQKEAADATADNARRQAESAANLQRFRDAGEQIVASLREQIQGYGLTGDALVVLKARLAGVGPEAERLVVQLRALREAREAADRAQAAKDNETAKLRAQQQSAQAYTESLRDELASLELSKAGYEEYKARKLGAADATAGLRSAIAAARAELASEASDIAKVNAALQAGAQAVANYKSAGQDLVAKYQTKLATTGKTPEEQDRQSGVLLGVSDQLNPLIDKTQQLARDEAALKAQLEQLNAVFKANSDEVNRNREAAERLEQRLQQKISNFGKSQEEIDKETASLAGNRAAVDSLYKKLNDLEAVELKRAAAVAQAKKETDAATVAEERRKNALDNLYKSAQRQIETHNLKPADIFTKDATALGGDPTKIKELAAGLREVEKRRRRRERGFA